MGEQSRGMAVQSLAGELGVWACARDCGMTVVALSGAQPDDPWMGRTVAERAYVETGEFSATRVGLFLA